MNASVVVAARATAEIIYLYGNETPRLELAERRHGTDHVRCAGYRCAVRANRQAPVFAASEIEIGADPDAVWDVLADFERWPSWNPDV